jgi:hypothetical protein
MRMLKVRLYVTESEEQQFSLHGVTDMRKASSSVYVGYVRL